MQSSTAYAEMVEALMLTNEKYKNYYDTGIWTKEMLHNVVSRKYGITAEEYFEITGEPYEA